MAPREALAFEHWAPTSLCMPTLPCYPRLALCTHSAWQKSRSMQQSPSTGIHGFFRLLYTGLTGRKGPHFLAKRRAQLRAKLTSSFGWLERAAKAQASMVSASCRWPTYGGYPTLGKRPRTAWRIGAAKLKEAPASRGASAAGPTSRVTPRVRRYHGLRVPCVTPRPLPLEA